MHRAESRRTTKVRASIFLSLWSQDTLLSWNWFVIICMEYCQPGEFTWALVSRDFIGASSCWRDWLTNNLSIQVDWYHMTPNLSHIVDLFDVTSIHLKTIWRWLAPSQITLLYQLVWCKAPRQTKADVFQGLVFHHHESPSFFILSIIWYTQLLLQGASLVIVLLPTLYLIEDSALCCQLPAANL